MNLHIIINFIKFNCRYNFPPILNHYQDQESFVMENNKENIK